MPDGEGPAELEALVVDDEREVADAYALRLEGFCGVETAYGGPEALSMIGEQTADVVLLDRHMPDMSGDEVLERLTEENFDGRVVMVTAVDPGFDVLELPFDDYLCKPVEREDLRAVVDQQRQILAYETLGEYFSVESKRAVVAAETRPDERDNHDEYATLAERAERLQARARRLLEDDTLLTEFDAIGREEL
ncbi:response regulator transcription factor [Halorhabdus salina]|uniref:response regulator transcription factor n=1 Tax=Halorhabdus salina TaxID=2750670 RepID=UPI0015EF596F|nr:response regulator [Halorhabdus salina]